MTFNYKKIITAILLVAITQPVYPGWFSVGSVQNGISRLAAQAKESPLLTGACVAGAVALGYYGWQWYKQGTKSTVQENNGINTQNIRDEKQETAQEHTQVSIQPSSGHNSPEANSPISTQYTPQKPYADAPENEEQDAPSQPSPGTIRKVIDDLKNQTTEDIPDFAEHLSDSASEEEEISTRIKVPNKDFSLEQEVQYTLEEQDRIRKGNTVLKALITDKYRSPAIGHGPAYLEDIVNVIWALYNQANKKKQAFTQGTFVIEDKNFKIFNFLIEYVKRHNKYVTGTAEDSPSVPASINQFAYRRISSHYKNNNKQYGIDIRYTETGNALSTLPAKKCHLLFGKIDEEKNLIFIKPEDHGIYYQEVHNHGIEYLKSQARKLFPNSYFGSDDALDCRKERVPQELIENAHNQFKNLFDVTDSDLVNTLLDKVKADGFKILFDMKDNPKEYIGNHRFKKTFIDAINAIITTYEQEYDNLEIRQGREVIIRAKDLGNIPQEDCEKREFNVSTLDEHSGWNFVEQAPEDILTSAQKCLKDLTERQLQATQEEIKKHIDLLEAARQEVFLLLTRTSPNFVSEVRETMIENLEKCSEAVNSPNKVYPYLYGDKQEEAFNYSYLTVQQHINAKKQTATEQELQDLRQVEYLFRNATSKQHFDAYLKDLKGEGALTELMRDDAETLAASLDKIMNCKAELESHINQLKKK